MSIVGKAAGPLGSFKAWITVNANRSATFSISPAAKKIVSQTSTQIVYLVDEAQTYTVSATDGTYSKSSTVSITAKKQSKSVTLTLFDLAFTLIAGGSTYNFTRNTASRSASGKYKYTKSGENWILEIYASGSLTFSAATQNYDVCVVGGGGGGGGATCGGSSYSAGGRRGGYGGGGGINTQSNKTITLNSSYTCTIGSGGAGGTAQRTSTYQPGTAGSNGTSSKFGSYTAGYGEGGSGGNMDYAVDDGDPGSNGSTTQGGVRAFGGGSSYPMVSGRSPKESTSSSVYGVGGGYGDWHSNPAGDPTASKGYAGTAGIIVIRNAR